MLSLQERNLDQMFHLHPSFSLQVEFMKKLLRN
ncbi:hypothetical protein NC653_029435 [Populus alba x Populus x berolinensis]|uniref:Uncharacterized protein n=1 Tax=Populus alba x Populus x berolinensis TaxID=444605 RepID=A0AAD6Q3G2_9ROSI|nr:hypothetical protein NC653_029435 [Populus alba x Populus x berolinensis]